MPDPPTPTFTVATFEITVHFLPLWAPALHVLPALRPARTRWRSTDSVPPSVTPTFSFSCAVGLSLLETAPSDCRTGAVTSGSGLPPPPLPPPPALPPPPPLPPP